MGPLVGAVLMVGGAASAQGPTFQLRSPDLPPGHTFTPEQMANDFGCHGGNQSPALQWTGAPAGTKSFAITMFDSYRPPQSGWWHWIVYDLPATTTGLPRLAGTPGGPGLPAGALQGLPDGEAPARHYYGPCPDPGDPPHRYVITVYALSVEHLDVPSTATSAQIDYVIGGKVLAKASITRPFTRPPGT
jgi:Raf kinase inhibitor-like YbhB/YbcL family protein